MALRRTFPRLRKENGHSRGLTWRQIPMHRPAQRFFTASALGMNARGEQSASIAHRGSGLVALGAWSCSGHKQNWRLLTSALCLGLLACTKGTLLQLAAFRNSIALPLLSISFLLSSGGLKKSVTVLNPSLSLPTEREWWEGPA